MGLGFAHAQVVMQTAWDSVEDTNVEGTGGSHIRFPLPAPLESVEELECSADLDAPTLPWTQKLVPAAAPMAAPFAAPTTPPWLIAGLLALLATSVALAVALVVV
jgi:hypothetical protein